MKRAGKVYLIGAGPGDPGLITWKGLERLRRADVILYDYLINRDLLKAAKPGAKLVFVGKRPGSAPAGQDRIQKEIVREARKGLEVARLKGGDPYLFGRGAEEGRFLKKAGIDFEVIPGVTSGIGSAAYAGVPLTERHSSSSVAFVTGHHADRKNPPLERWKSLVHAVDTIVVYMGIGKIKTITGLLIRAGMRPSTPAAVVEWGTWTRQRSVFSNVSKIAAEASQKKLSSPAILITGSVVRFHKELDWFEHLPLFGKKVVITRAAGQASQIKRSLEKLGAETLELPAIEMQGPEDTRPMDEAIGRIGSFDWIIFTSANGVESFFGRLAALKKDARAFPRARIAAVGLATAESLLDHGIFADFMPGEFTTDHLFEELRRSVKNIRGKRFLLLRSQIAPPAFTQKFREAGAHTVEVSAYRTLLPKDKLREAYSKIKDRSPDILTFTSSSTVTNLLAGIGRSGVKKLLRTARVVSIGPVTSKTLKSERLPVHREALVHTAEGLIDAVVALTRKKK